MQKFQGIGQAMYQRTAESQQAEAAATGGGASEPSGAPTENENDVVEGEIVDEGGAS